MCIDDKKFYGYMDKVEGLLSEVRADNIAIRSDLAEVKKDVAAVKDDTKDLKYDIAGVKKDTGKTEEHLKHMNGKVARHELEIHDMQRERSPQYRAIGCPQASAIKELSESLMSASVLREYLDKQEIVQREMFITRDRRATKRLAVFGILIALMTLGAMFYIG